MTESEAAQALGILVGDTQGWNAEAAAVYLQHFCNVKDLDALTAACQHILATHDQPGRPSLARILDRYRYEETQNQRRRPEPAPRPALATHDIVTRLRSQCRCGPLDPSDQVCDVCEAAADIKQLRRLCSHMASMLDDCQPYGAVSRAWVTARLDILEEWQRYRQEHVT